MQERASGPPPIMAWALLFMGIVGIIIGLVQAPGVGLLELGGNNTTEGTETPAEGPSADGRTGDSAIEGSAGDAPAVAARGEPVHSRPVAG